MPTYRVTWEIDIEADTPLQAAREAYETQISPESFPPVFKIQAPGKPAVTIDLDAKENQ